MFAAHHTPATNAPWALQAKGDKNRRQLTFSLYLNEEWEERDGGKLRVYLPRNCSKAVDGGECVQGGNGGRTTTEELEEYMDVTPQGGTCAIFLSADFPHEVLPSKADRRSLTGWFLRRDT
jgi:SM-20-related protein